MLLATTGNTSSAQQTGGSPPLPQTVEQAETQRQQAETLRKEADRRYAADEAACYKKILVNDCIVEARQRRTESLVEARRLDTAAREFQRKSRRVNVETEKAQRDADNTVREARQGEQAQAYRADEAAKVAEREQKRQRRTARSLPTNGPKEN